MGTSASYRAPQQPRWNAFIAALTSDTSVDRMRSELFNAGLEWQTALSAPAVAAFADAVGRLYEELPRRLAQATRADSEIGAIVAEARHASMDVGFSAAAAIAERAFARLLLGTLQGAGEDPGQASARWSEARGPAPADLVAKYVGEVLGQYARHVTDREAGRLVREALGAAESARLSETLAEQAMSIGVAVASDAFQPTAEIASTWAEVLGRAFEAGRALPRSEA